MKDTLTVLPLFSCPITLVEEIYDMSEFELNFIKNLKQSDCSTNTVSENKNILDLPELNNLKKWIEDKINFYFFNFLKVSNLNKIYLTQSWSNITKKGQSHPKHVHPNSIISGVLHFNDGDSPINFYSPQEHYPLSFNFKEYNLFNSVKWDWPTKKYGLLIFPSKVRHGVETQKIERDRVSVSFNTWIKGVVGEEDITTLLEVR
jgi:uncharacterized protein (TIGR02466 family)